MLSTLLIRWCCFAGRLGVYRVMASGKMIVKNDLSRFLRSCFLHLLRYVNLYIHIFYIVSK